MAGTANRGKTRSSNGSETPIADDILRAIRRILRKSAEDRQQLSRDGDISVSGLLCLRKVAEATKAEPITVAEVAAAVQLSNATVSRISDRLESAGLIDRNRSTVDRRKVFLRLTPKGRRRVKRLPPPLHEEFLMRLSNMRKSDQLAILASLEQVVELMGAADLDAAPMLTPETSVKPSPRT